ncbi:MAG TPA: phenylphosphate carboxylase subunit delta [Oceanospirillaceae bacterium]|nr:phenylphosphate carboxylase subunit delta [Oceanospirillaceae bacterium]
MTLAIAPEILSAAQPIQLLALDVDGILSDGQLYFGNQGEEIKAFNSLDGHGIKMLQASGVKVAIITGRTSNIVAQRASQLGIDLLLQGREDKLQALCELTQHMQLDWRQMAYMGDDWPDLAAIIKVGLGITVPNAASGLATHCQYLTQRSGGQGAVREVCDLIMQAQGSWQLALQSYLNTDLPTHP